MWLRQTAVSADVIMIMMPITAYLDHLGGGNAGPVFGLMRSSCRSTISLIIIAERMIDRSSFYRSGADNNLVDRLALFWAKRGQAAFPVAEAKIAFHCFDTDILFLWLRRFSFNMRCLVSWIFGGESNS